jgi:stress response protein YsnF
MKVVKIQVNTEVVIMSIFGSIFGTEDDQDITANKKNEKQTDEGTLQLRKEELDINKNKVQTGEVILSKEVVEEQQTVNVPVTHEEVVIERRHLDNQPTDSQITSNSDSNSSASSCSDCGCEDIDKTANETIRIPVSEEKVDVGKHTVVTEEISAHKRSVEEIQKVDEVLRREEAKIDKDGNPIITNDKALTETTKTSDEDISGDWF